MSKSASEINRELLLVGYYQVVEADDVMMMMMFYLNYFRLKHEKLYLQLRKIV
jgi:hypothetical protein